MIHTMSTLDQQKTLMIDSDTESNNETHGAGEHSLLLQNSGLKTTLKIRRLYTCAYTEYSNPRRVSKMTELIFGLLK